MSKPLDSSYGAILKHIENRVSMSPKTPPILFLILAIVLLNLFLNIWRHS